MYKTETIRIILDKSITLCNFLLVKWVEFVQSVSEHEEKLVVSFLYSWGVGGGECVIGTFLKIQFTL